MFLPSLWYCLTVFFVSQALHSEFRYFDFKMNLVSLALIWYKKIRIPEPDDQDMSIFLYNVALDCSCLLFDTALWFSSYLEIYILEFWYLDLEMNLVSLPLIWYKKIRIPEPYDQDMRIFYTASRFVFPVFFLILPYGFLCISRSSSPNSDIFISQ